MTVSTDDAARRKFWAEQMQLGYDLAQQMIAFDVREGGEGFASIRDEADAAGVEMLFSDTKVAGNLDRIYYIRKGLVKDVIAIGKAMNERGWIMKVEDGYRSLEMQTLLGRKPDLFDAILKKCIWENGGKKPPVELVFRRALVLIANIPKNGTHMSGSAIDISVFRRDDGSEVCRGKPYLEMSELTPMRSPFISDEALKNRLDITAMMEARGFMHFPYEFWHYNKGDALGHILSKLPPPARYGAVHWDPKTNKVEAYADPTSPINPMNVIEAEIAAAMKRAGA